jgi:hypothetical protein
VKSANKENVEVNLYNILIWDCSSIIIKISTTLFMNVLYMMTSINVEQWLIIISLSDLGW